MASRAFQIIGSITPLIFGTLSFAFVITSFVSRDWVRQDYFPPQLQPLDWKTPVFTIYRSPFILCSANPSKPNSSTTQYDITCNRFKISGRGQTACQTPNETDAYSSITGDWRMCQQVHMSGNLMLAALVFVCVGFVTMIGLAYVFISRASKTGQIVQAIAQTSSKRALTDTNDGTEEVEGVGSTPYADEESSSTPATAPAPTIPTTASQPIQSIAVIIATYGLMTVVLVTAMCAFLSQFYGILGLVQSQPDNGAWASMSLGEVQDGQTGDLHHAPWVQGNALSIYVSLAWFFSALTAGTLGVTWLAQFR